MLPPPGLQLIPLIPEILSLCVPRSSFCWCHIVISTNIFCLQLLVGHSTPALSSHAGGCDWKISRDLLVMFYPGLTSLSHWKKETALKDCCLLHKRTPLFSTDHSEGVCCLAGLWWRVSAGPTLLAPETHWAPSPTRSLTQCGNLDTQCANQVPSTSSTLC